MRNWAYYNSLNGNASAEMKSWIDNRANEGFDEFKKRVKGWKSYSEEMLLEEVYNYIRYSSSLQNIIKSNNKTNFDLWRTNNNLLKNNKQLKKENEKLKNIIINKFKEEN